MRTQALAVVMLAVPVMALGQAPPPGPPLDSEDADRLKADVLKSIRDAADARKARPKLLDIERRQRVSGTRRVGDLCLAEFARIGKLKGVLAALVGTEMMKFHDEFHCTITSVEVKRLAALIQREQQHAGRYPAKLTDVAPRQDFRFEDFQFVQGPGAGLLDPWGRPYQYDPTGPRNGGKRPDIWSLGPPWAKPGEGVIGNWPETNGP